MKYLLFIIIILLEIKPALAACEHFEWIMYNDKNICLESNNSITKKLENITISFKKKFFFKDLIKVKIVTNHPSGEYSSLFSVNNRVISLGVFPNEKISTKHYQIFIHELTHFYMSLDKNSIYYFLGNNKIFKEAIPDLVSLWLYPEEGSKHLCANLYDRKYNFSYKSKDLNNFSNKQSIKASQKCCLNFKNDPFCKWVLKQKVLNQSKDISLNSISVHRAGLPIIGFLKEAMVLDKNIIQKFFIAIEKNKIIKDYECSVGNKIFLVIPFLDNKVYKNIFKSIINDNKKIKLLYDKYNLDKALDLAKEEDFNRLKMTYLIDFKTNKFDVISCKNF